MTTKTFFKIAALVVALLALMFGVRGLSKYQGLLDWLRPARPDSTAIYQTRLDSLYRAYKKEQESVERAIKMADATRLDAERRVANARAEAARQRALADSIAAHVPISAPSVPRALYDATAAERDSLRSVDSVTTTTIIPSLQQTIALRDSQVAHLTALVGQQRAQIQDNVLRIADLSRPKLQCPAITPGVGVVGGGSNAHFGLGIMVGCSLPIRIH